MWQVAELAGNIREIMIIVRVVSLIYSHKV
jgi:hypothetical protein